MMPADKIKLSAFLSLLVLSAALAQTSDTPLPVELPSNDCGWIEIYKYKDSNGNGNLDQDDEEFAGVTFDISGPADFQLVTDANGYAVSGCVPTGAYSVTEQVPSGWSVSPNPVGVFVNPDMSIQVGILNLQAETTSTTTSSTTTTSSSTTTTTDSTTTTTQTYPTPYETPYSTPYAYEYEYETPYSTPYDYEYQTPSEYTYEYQTPYTYEYQTPYEYETPYSTPYEYQTPAPSACEDGTLEGECSTNKPDYCPEGESEQQYYLVPRCDLCGCPEGSECAPTSGQCIEPPPSTTTSTTSTTTTSTTSTTTTTESTTTTTTSTTTSTTTTILPPPPEERLLARASGWFHDGVAGYQLPRGTIEIYETRDPHMLRIELHNVHTQEFESRSCFVTEDRMTFVSRLIRCESESLGKLRIFIVPLTGQLTVGFNDRVTFRGTANVPED